MARYAFIALAVVAWVGGPVEAREPTPPAPPSVNSPVPEQPVSPYPMSYSEELARRLGISQGHMDVFSLTPDRDDGFFPTLKGGVDRSGAGLKLEWSTP
jgi:hypothetical protein